MSMNKAILHGKEHRKKYTGAKAVDMTCRNHGSCPWCYGNRTFKARREGLYSLQQVKDWNEEMDGKIQPVLG